MNEKERISDELLAENQLTDADEQAKKTKTRFKCKWRWCRRIITLFTVIMLIPVLFLCTGYGQRKALEWVDNLVEPLTIGSVGGSIQDGLILSKAQFTMDGLDVQVGEIGVKLGFGCLIHYQVCLDDLHIKETKVIVDTAKLPPSQPKPDSAPFTELNLPLEMLVKHISLDNIAVQVDEMEINLSHFDTALMGKGRTVKILPTHLEGLNLLFALKLEEQSEQAVNSTEKNANTETVLSPQNAQDIADQVIKEAAEKTGEKVVKRFQELQGKNTEQEQLSNTPVDWAAIQAQLEKPLLDKKIPFTLPLDLFIEQIEVKNVFLAQKAKAEKGSVAQPISLLNVDSLMLQAEATQQHIHLTTLNFYSDQGELTLQGTLDLQNNYPLSWQLKGNEAQNAKVKLPFNRIQLNLDGELYGKTVLNLNTEGAIKASFNGEVELAKARTPFMISLNGESMRYPFSTQENSEKVLKLDNVGLNLAGDLLNYQVNANVNAKGMGFPASSATLKGVGELTHFNLQNLTLNTLEGKAQLQGMSDWTTGVEWAADLALDHINTQSLTPNWRAVLSGTLISKGYVGRGKSGTDWNVAVSNIDVNGSLQQKNLRLLGDLQASSQQLLQVPSLSLVYGENKVDLKGVLGEQSDFLAEIKAPNLQGLLPNFKASLNGKAKLSGKVSEPNLDVDLVANNVGYEAVKFQHLSAKGKVTTEKMLQGNLELGLKQFAYNEINIENALLTAQGSEDNHKLKLVTKGNPVGGELQIAGKFDRLQQLWAGQLSNVLVQATDLGRFQTDKVVNLQYDNKTINTNISAHCWNNPKIHLCFLAAFNVGREGKIPFDIRQFDLSLLQPYLGNESVLSGIVNAKGDAAWFNTKQPEVNVDLSSNSIKFLQKLDGGKSFPLSLSPVKMNVAMANNSLSLKSDLRIENNGKLSTDVVMKDLSKTRTLAGAVNIEGITLKLIRPFLGKGDSVDGNINARLTLGGTASLPLLHGNLHLTELNARSNTMPFDITNGQLAVNFKGATSTLSGQVQTTDSELRLEGDADWRDLKAWKTRVQAKANRFNLDIPNIAKVSISPDVQVVMTPKTLMLSGNIDIPWARIEVEELPESAVNVSDDEVIMDGSVKAKVPLTQRDIPTQTASGIVINADININIGNDVKLKAYGLKSNVNGLLSVRQGKQGLGLYGQVRLDDGRFAAYGQDLLIRKGNISFAGSPTQPSLDIEAIRNPEAMEDATITAGVRVTGLADNPAVKVFSDPAMSQNEALSYILTGRSLENSGDGSSSNAVAAALLSMSLSKSSKLVGDVGSTFGLKDLSVTTAGIGDNTKVEVSASLSPKFKVKYGVGIFAPLTELTLRYNLTPKLYLQWVSSVSQAVDLMYRFQFDSLF